MTYKLCYNPGQNPVRLDDEGTSVDGQSWAPYDDQANVALRALDMGFIMDRPMDGIDDKSNPDAYAAVQEVKRLNGETDQTKEEDDQDPPAESAATVSDKKPSKKVKG